MARCEARKARSCGDMAGMVADWADVGMSGKRQRDREPDREHRRVACAVDVSAARNAQMADRGGFEPPIEFPLYTRSRRAP